MSFSKKMDLAFRACNYLAFCPHMGSSELARARMRAREIFVRNLMHDIYFSRLLSAASYSTQCHCDTSKTWKSWYVLLVVVAPTTE